MKKFIASIIAGSAVLPICAQVSFSDNFDSYPLGALGAQGGWDSQVFGGGAAQIEISDLWSTSPTNSAYSNLWFHGAATGNYSWHWIGHEDGEPEGSMELSYNFLVEEDGTRNDTTVTNMNLNKVSDGSPWMTFQFQSSGDPNYDDSMWLVDSAGGFNYVGSTGDPTNTWHNVRARYNSANGNVVVWLNDQMIYRPFFMGAARVGWSNMLTYAFAANAHSASVYDDINWNSKPTTTINGNVNFEGMTTTLYNGFIFWVQASFWSGTSKVDETAGYVDIDGNLTMDCSLPDGVYTAFFDGWYCQRRSATVVVSGGSASVNLTLPSGDCDSTGVVDIADFGIISAAFDAQLDTDPDTTGDQPSPNWDYRADLNGDGLTDIADYSLLAANFDGVDEMYP